MRDDTASASEKWHRKPHFPSFVPDANQGAGFISNLVTERNKVLIFQIKMEIFFLLTGSVALFLSDLSSGKQSRR